MFVIFLREKKLNWFIFFYFNQINASDSIEQMEIEINNTANVYKTPPYLYENTFGSPYKSVYIYISSNSILSKYIQI